MKTLLLIPIITMASYLAYIRIRYEMTPTISATAKKHQHWWEKLWFMLTLVAGVALPVIVVGIEKSTLGNFQWMWFLAGSGIAFVGAAQMYWKGGSELQVHMIGTYTGIILGIIACLVHFFTPVTLGAVAAFIFFTFFISKLGIKIHNHTYWVEVAALVTVLIVLWLY